MSLYDDLDSKARTTEKVAAWSSGIKLLQSQMLLKKAAVTQPKRESMRRTAQVLPPVIDLKSKQKEEDELMSNLSPVIHAKPLPVSAGNVRDFDWNIVNEYDPLWPNEYEKVVKEMKERRDRRDREEDRNERIERNDRKRKSRFGDNDDVVTEKQMIPMSQDEEPTEIVRRGGGAAIAPPPSLQEPSTPPQASLPDKPSGGSIGGYSANSVAAKIMAKYGFKEGQGLGKKEQGMSVALQVEKTSKRGGRIIHEKDGGNAMPPPPATFAMPPPPAPDSPSASAETQPPKPEPSITEIMKSPSKVVLLRNMVGPGDVDEDLEPEVKDECNTKYGDVVKVVIYEINNTVPEEAVRIFVEFKRIESAIKAVVDLNGRFFGGRQVRAGFYSVEKLNAYELLD